MQQDLNTASNNVSQEMSRMKNACTCGLFSGKNVEGLWTDGGSLEPMDDETVVISKRAFHGDCLRIISLENTIVVTDRRFIVKRMQKIGPCTIHAEEASHHFANLQHVGVERGLYLEGAFRKRVISYLLLSLAIFLFVVRQTELGVWLTVIYCFYRLYNWIMIFINWNTDFLVIDVSGDAVIGTWHWGFHTRARSYQTLRLPLQIEACFQVKKELLKKHPLLPSPHAEV